MRVSQWPCLALLLGFSTPVQSRGQPAVEEFEHGTMTAKRYRHSLRRAG